MLPSCKKCATLLHLLKMTHNSALDASPPKASKLPEVMLSSMDLLAEKHRRHKTKHFTCLDVDRLCCFFHTDTHLPHRLSLSLTASCVFSSAADSSLRDNGESEHFGTPLQSCRECARWFVELFYFQCLVQQALWKQLSVQSETPATSCMWCANGSQTRSSEAFFTGAQPELISLSLMVLRQRFLYVRQKTARDYLQVATFKRPSAQVLAASNGNENCKVFYWGPTWSHVFLIQAVMSG